MTCREGVKIHQERIHIGYFNSIEDAIKAREKAEIEGYGEWRERSK